jgi:hypothetical protein
MIPIHDLLTNPSYLLSLSDAELKRLLEPYFPDVRTPILPQEKPKKVGLQKRQFDAMMSNTAFAAELEAFKKSRK